MRRFKLKRPTLGSALRPVRPDGEFSAGPHELDVRRFNRRRNNFSTSHCFNLQYFFHIAVGPVRLRGRRGTPRPAFATVSSDPEVEDAPRHVRACLGVGKARKM